MIENNLRISEQKEDNLVVGAKGGAIAFVLKMSATVIGFLNQIVLARILGAHGIGEVLLAVSIVNISAQLAKFGMEEAMMRFIPLYIDRKDSEKLKGTIYFVLKFCFLLSIIFVFIIFFLSKYIAIDIFHSEGLLKILPIIVIAIPAAVMRGIIGGVLKGYKDTLKALLPEFLVLPAFRIAIFLILTLHESSALYAVIAFILGETFAIIFSIKFLLKKMENLRTVTLQHENRKVFQVASTMIFSSMSVLLYTQADLWVLGIFTSTEEVGVYGVAARLVTLIVFTMMAFSAVIPPIMSSTHASGQHNELKRVVSDSSRWILSMAMPIILILVLEGKIILKYAYGVNFVHGYTALVILSVGQLIKAGSGLVGVLLQMTGGHKTFMKITIIGGLSNVILNLILVPHFGMLGAASATAFCLSMINFICVILIYKKLSVLTLAKGIKFDAIFITIVAILYFLFNYYNFFLGNHLLLMCALVVYIGKIIIYKELPWRFLLTKYRT